MITTAMVLDALESFRTAWRREFNPLDLADAAWLGGRLEALRRAAQPA